MESVSKRLSDRIVYCKREIAALEALDVTPVPGGASRRNMEEHRQRLLSIFRTELTTAEKALAKWQDLPQAHIFDEVAVCL